MARLTPQEIAEKQIRKSAAAVADYRKGVESVEVNPCEEAAKAVDRYRDGVLTAIDDGSYVEGCMSVPKEEWIAAASGKGGDRYAKGVEAARDKIVDFQTTYGPIRDQVRRQVRAMPNTTLEDRLARMEANARGLNANKYRRRRRR